MIIPISILISSGHDADLWVVRGIAIGGMWSTFSPLNANSDDLASYFLRNSTAWLHSAVGCVCHLREYDFLSPVCRIVYTRAGVDTIQNSSPVTYCGDWYGTIS